MSPSQPPGRTGDGAALPPVQARAGGPGAAVGSPCINVCKMDSATGWCAGCLRTLAEIATWSQLGDADKQAVWQQLPERRVQWTALEPPQPKDPT